jgi:DNA-directed RNA polymerase specialized sigma24 family protein
MANQQLTDAALIKMIISGDSEKFKTLIRKYSQQLYKIALSYNFDHTDAEELMEETFILAYKNLKHLHEKRRFKTFLIGMMLHECISKNKSELPLKDTALTALSAKIVTKVLTGCVLIPLDQFCLFA